MDGIDGTNPKGNQSTSTSPSEGNSEERIQQVFADHVTGGPDISSPPSLDMGRVSAANSNLSSAAAPLESFRQLSPKIHQSNVQHRFAKLCSEADSIASLWMLQCIAEIYQFQRRPTREAAEEIVDTYLAVADEMGGRTICERGLYSLANDQEFMGQVESIQNALVCNEKISGELFDKVFEHLIAILDKQFLSEEFEVDLDLSKPRRKRSVEGKCLEELTAAVQAYRKENPSQDEEASEAVVFGLVESMVLIPSYPLSDSAETYQRRKAERIACLALQYSDKGRSTIELIDHLLQLLFKQTNMAGREAIEEDLYTLRYRLTSGELDGGEVSREVEDLIVLRGSFDPLLAEYRELAIAEVGLRIEVARLWKRELVYGIGSFDEEAIKEVDRQRVCQQVADVIKSGQRVHKTLDGPVYWISDRVKNVLRTKCQALFRSDSSLEFVYGTCYLEVNPQIHRRCVTTTLQCTFKIEGALVARFELKLKVRFDAEAHPIQLLIRPHKVEFSDPPASQKKRRLVLEALQQLDSRNDSWYLDL